MVITECKWQIPGNLPTINSISDWVLLGLEHYNWKHPQTHKSLLNHLEVKSVSCAVRCWVKIIFPSTESALRVVQLSTSVWWRAARLMLTTIWASAAGTWLEGLRLLQKLEVLSWTFQVSHWENRSFVKHYFCKKIKNFSKAAESLDEMMEIGSIIAGGDFFIEQSSKNGLLLLSESTTDIFNIYKWFIVLNSYCYCFYPLSAVKHRWWEEQGNSWLCIWYRHLILILCNIPTDIEV